MAHAAEWGHWYSRQGTPVYELPKADGSGMRPVTIRDARKMGLVPGVSGVSRCAAAPALEMWKARQVLLAALTLPRKDGENDDSYCARIMEDSKEQGKQAAARGTEIHGYIQGYYEGRLEMPPAMWIYVKSAHDALQDWVGGDFLPVWTPEQSFASHYGFGGKVDLNWRAGGFVADVKTKEFTGEDLAAGKKLAWDEHCTQLAAYRVGLGIPRARCGNVFVSVTEPGLSIVHEWKEDELQRGWQMFKALLAYWSAKNKYDPSWQEEKVAA